MKKVKIIGVIVLVVAVAVIGWLLFSKQHTTQVKNNQSSSQSY